MNPYPTYKPSGIDWLGEIPEHWKVKRVKDVTTSITGFAFNSSKYSDSGIKLVRGINVKESVLNWNDTYYWPNITPDLKRFALKSEDVLIQMDGSKVGKNFCIVQNDDLPLLLVQRVTRLRVSKKYNSKYLFYLIAGSLFFDWISIKKTDPMVPHITLKDIEEFNLFLLPFPEQTNIANYLDSKIATIDRKIELLTSKANKYKALRHSLINETVCRGLNPDAPLKESGIEWIGKIPKHWEVKRFKDIAYSITGLTYSPDDIVDEDQGVLVLRSGNIQNGELSFNDNVFVNSTIGKYLFVRKGDILLCSRNGSANLVGKSAYIDKSYNYSWGAFMTVARSKMGRFLFYALNSDLFKRNMGLFQTSTVNQLTSKMLDNMAFLVPPKKEQIDIINYLDEKTAQIDAIVLNIEQQITKLTQLRKSLINDVVTGKIKVTED